MDFIGDLVDLFDDPLVVEKVGGTDLTKQIPNMGIEVEFACDISPTEVAKILNHRMEDESFAGAPLTFIGSDKYGTMPEQEGGKKRFWAVTADNSAADKNGRDDEGRDDWIQERTEDLMREKASELVEEANADWEVYQDERNNEFREQHGDKRDTIIDHIADRVEDAKEGSDPKLINDLDDLYRDSGDPEIRFLLQYITGEEIEDNRDIKEGDTVRLKKRMTVPGDNWNTDDLNFDIGSIGTVVWADKNGVEIKMDVRARAPTDRYDAQKFHERHYLSIPLTMVEKSDFDPKDRPALSGKDIKVHPIKNRSDVKKLMRTWGGEAVNTGDDLTNHRKYDYKKGEMESLIEDIFPIFGLDKDKVQSFFHEDFSIDTEAQDAMEWLEEWFVKKEIDINLNFPQRPDKDGGWTHAFRRALEGRLYDTMSDNDEVFREEAENDAESMYEDDESNQSYGVEIVTPRIAMTDRNIKEVARIFNDCVSYADGRTHSSAGLHVHVGYRRGLLPIHILKTAYIFATEGNKISRRAKRPTNQYASSISHLKNMVNDAVVDALTRKDPKTFRTKIASAARAAKEDRYKVLNLTNKNTMEIRIGSSELVDDPKDMILWLQHIRDAYQKAVNDDYLEIQDDNLPEGTRARFTLDINGTMTVQKSENNGKWETVFSDRGDVEKSTEVDYKEIPKEYDYKVRRSVEEGGKLVADLINTNGRLSLVPEDKVVWTGVAAFLASGTTNHYDNDMEAYKKGVQLYTNYISIVGDSTIHPNNKIKVSWVENLLEFFRLLPNADGSNVITDLTQILGTIDPHKGSRYVSRNGFALGNLFDQGRYDRNEVGGLTSYEKSKYREADVTKHKEKQSWREQARKDYEGSHLNKTEKRQARREARSTARSEKYYKSLRTFAPVIDDAMNRLKTQDPTSWETINKARQQAIDYASTYGQKGDPRPFNRWLRRNVPQVLEGMGTDEELIAEIEEGILFRQSMEVLFG